MIGAHHDEHGHDQERERGERLMSEQQERRESGYRRTSYQGERLGLRLNWQAIAELRDLLDGLSADGWWRRRSQLRLRLPDGRDLTLTVVAADDGAIRDGNGEYVGDDGLAHGDVTGDLAMHHDAAEVMEAVTRPPGYVELPAQGDGQQVDEGWLQRRDRRVLDTAVGRLEARWGGPCASSQQPWVDDVRRRAEQAAAATRAERLARAQDMAGRIAKSLPQPRPRPELDGRGGPSAGIGM